MTDPTIPELVARLRELHNARRYPTEMLVATIRDDQSAQVYATSTGPMRVVRPVAETTVDHADLIAETLNALPAILDALERNPSRDSGGVEGAPFDTDGLEWIERLDGSLDLFRAGSGANLATVYTNGTWFTWGANGPGGESGKAPDVETAKARAIKALVRQPHSPDGGKVELPEHLETELELLRTQRALSDTERDYLRASEEADRLFERAVAAESLTTWRPISEPPSAEVHAWCGGRYMFESDDGRGFVMTVNFDPDELAEFFGALTCKHYLPIPPSDERRV